MPNNARPSDEVYTRFRNGGYVDIKGIIRSVARERGGLKELVVCENAWAELAPTFNRMGVIESEWEWATRNRVARIDENLIVRVDLPRA